MMTKRILIVGDDVTEMQATFGPLLAGHRVLYAVGTLQAMARLSDDREVTLILLDVSASKLHGLDVLSRIRSNPAVHDVPVVIVGADPRVRRALEMMVDGGGVAGHLPKPVRPVQLLSLLEDAVA